MPADMTEYTEITLPSGVRVSIRSRTFEEWLAGENERSALLDKMTKAAAGEVVRLSAEYREQRLAFHVQGFASLKAQLRMKDIVFIEEQVAALEGREIPLGNSLSGGDG